MNSDKMDQYYREQIRSLDQEPVPGTAWTPGKGWAGIRSARREKKVWLWWTSAAAAVILLLLSGILWMNQSGIIRTNTLADSGNMDRELGAEKPATEPAEKWTPVEPAIANPEQQNSAEEPEILNDLVAVQRSASENLHFIPKKRALIPSNFTTPTILTMDLRHFDGFEDDAAADNGIFNRVYVFRRSKPTEEKLIIPKTDVLLRIDLTMKTSGDPPRGVISTLRRSL